MISFDASLQVIDSSKLSTFMDCPRQFFYRHVLGWRPASESGPNASRNDLHFGTSWHAAMEYLLLHGYTPQTITEAFDVFLTKYREKFSPDTDQNFVSKNPANVLPALIQYVKDNKHDNFTVLYTEVAGTVPVGTSISGAERILHFRLDSILQDHRGLFTMDHKTASQFSRQWRDQWALSMQMSAYTHVLYCLADYKDVFGAVVNGTAFKKGGTENERVDVRKTREQMQTWLYNVNYFMDMIEWELKKLSELDPKAEVMQAFPMNTNSCTKYFGCPYLDLCQCWANPSKRCAEPPSGYEVEFWDPRRDETEVKKVMHLERTQ